MTHIRTHIRLVVVFFIVLCIYLYSGEIYTTFVVDTDQINNTATIIDTSSQPEILIDTPITTVNEESPAPTTLPAYTTASLAQFNGEDPTLPIYIAFDGDVYDVSSGRKFYGPEGTYHFLAGSDGTSLLKIMGGDIIKKKYPVIGTFSP
ncbi:MAG: hypothetical protein NUW00_02310 [Candidatus Kaiserbacteria bacterium]|nr:hypothetical protein [Candidatus Kaiserbacteria bacterium]